MPVCDFTCLKPGENSCATCALGLASGNRVTINGERDLSNFIRFNDGGCVYSVTLESTSSLNPYDYCLRVDAQGPRGMTSGNGYLYFTDAGGDTYSLKIFSSARKEHTLRYNSYRPEITSIVWKKKKK